MKKTAIVLITLLCMIMGIALVACQNDSKGEVTGGELPVPTNIKNSGNYFEWDAVPNASGYMVKFDGEELKAEVNHFTCTTSVVGIHKVQIKAIGKDKFTDSKYSKEFTFEIPGILATPALKTDFKKGNTTVKLTWDAVENAKEYELKIGTNLDSVEPIKVNGTSYEIDITKDKFKSIDEYRASVKAISKDTNKYLDSDTNVITAFVNSTKIAAPTNLKYDGSSRFTWDSQDENARKFEVSIYRKADAEVAAGTEIVDGWELLDNQKMPYDKYITFNELGLTKDGQYKISVKAISNDKRNYVYYDSDAISMEFRVLPKVESLGYDMASHMLSWKKVDGATGYTINAVTSKTNSPQIINVNFKLTDEELAKDTITLDITKATNFYEFQKASNVYKVFTFSISPIGDVKNNEALVFPGNNNKTYVADDSYFQYKPVEADYKVADGETSIDLQAEWKNIKVEPTAKSDTYPEHYEVKTFAQFMWALENVSSSVIKLGANIKIESTELISPITSFAGVLDGDKHIINGFKVTREFKRDSISMLGTIKKDAVVKNLVVSSVKVEMSVVGKDASLITTGLIADVNDGTIDSVVVDGTLDLMGNINGAAIVGVNNGTIKASAVNVTMKAKSVAPFAVENNGVISNVTSNGAITGVAVDSTGLLGGIVAVNNKTGVITYAVSTITGLLETPSKDANSETNVRSYIGGIVAENYGKIDYSYFKGKLNSNSTNDVATSAVGGFVGYNKGEIVNSYVDAKSIEKMTSDTFLGGFVGINEGTISNVYSSIAISSESVKNGGFVGKNTGKIESVAYNKGRVSDKLNVAFEGTVDKFVGYEVNNQSLALTVLDKNVFTNEYNINDRKFEGPIILKDVIYVEDQFAASVTHGVDLTSNDKLTKINNYYVAGTKQTVAKGTQGFASNSYQGYQIIKYTHTIKVDGKDKVIELNRLVRVE